MTVQDANDYSRFDKIAEEDDNLEQRALSSERERDVLSLLAAAQALKDRGNEQFKEGQLRLARESYEDALLELRDLRSAEAIAALPSEALRRDLRGCVCLLQSNLSMVALKEQSWFKALSHAKQALALDADNVKALFRRGLASARLQQFEDATRDLERVLVLEPGNVSAKKELAAVQKAVKTQAKREQATFGKLFSSSASLYDDREREREEKKRLLEEQREKEQAQWRENNEQRVARGEEELSFEDWKKDREKKEKEEKRERASADTPSSSSKQSSSEKAPSSSSPPLKLQRPKREEAEKEEDENDEEEAKILAETKAKGYCYFRDTKGTAPKRDFTPKALDSAPSPVPSGSEATPSQQSGVTASSWNTAGTWEERDCSESVKAQIRERVLALADIETHSLQDSETAARRFVVSASVREVSKLEGEAQIVLSRGKKRHLFDFQMKLDFEISVREIAGEEHAEGDGAKAKVYKGSLSYSDVSPQSSLDCSLKWKKTPAGNHERYVKESLNVLQNRIADEMQRFENEFRTW